ncbi:cytochrome c oxidase subunit 3 [Chondrinema litorale]|uniref:cytochrome c oxidase subunit 3 n=1 Tax=Chondrinema litorale TaxID=2994555 RepID=UPI002543632F|nr:cytochrome c oxidase subunit 3 [Chondrinema litorale]UZR95763.1 cytochrome c oxidase subunit 3 [Chondrinema litorale]
MNAPEKNDNNKNTSLLNKIENTHSSLIITYLLIGSIFFIFFVLVTAFFLLTINKNIALNYTFPSSFILSTLILLLSSITVYKSIEYFNEEKSHLLRRSLELTFILGLVFCALQISAWQELQQSNIFLKGEPSGSFIYLISGLHALHVIGGLGFLLRIYLIAYRVTKDPVYSLITFTNPYEKIRLKMFSIYWHFMDLLWLMIFSIILFTF